MNTNNAPERKVSEGGMNAAQSYAEDFITYGEFSSEEEVHLVCRALLQAMQPQVSESNVFADLGMDDSELLKTVADILIACGVDVKGKDQKHRDLKAGAAILVKHRQTAAVSDDAVEVTDKILNTYPGTPSFPKHMSREIQAYGDACRLDGARKMQRKAANEARLACLVPPDGGCPTDEEIAVCEEAEKVIRALSPETVCGGE